MKSQSPMRAAWPSQGVPSHLLDFGCVHGHPFDRNLWSQADASVLEALAVGPSPGLQSALSEAVRNLLSSREADAEIGQSLKRIEATLDLVLQEIGAVKGSLWVPIQSVEPEPYDVLTPFTAVVTAIGDEFEATFFDANLHACGNNPEEAVSNLKGVILDVFDRLTELGDEMLGPGPLSQKRILSRHIRGR